MRFRKLFAWQLGRKLRFWWRRLRGRCVFCGGDVTGAYLVAQPGYPSATPRTPKICHWCYKKLTHAQNYGVRTK